MNMSVRFTTDLRRTFRATRRLRRKSLYAMRCIGVLTILAGLLAAVGRGSVALTVTCIILGLVLIAEMDVVIWLRLRRNRDVIVQPVTVTLTDEGISRATPTTSVEFTWDAIRQVIDERDLWIFVVNRLQTVTLAKEMLNSDQRTELAVFLATRRPGAQRRDGRRPSDVSTTASGRGTAK